MPSFNEADVSDKPIGIRNRPALTPQKIAAIREAYQQQMESLLSVDDGVKAIVDALRAKGELDNTLLVFTDDNGFFDGQHRVPSGKVLLYEPSIRVPLLMRGPGVPKDQHLEQMTANIDLAPTVMDAANAQAGRVMDGKTLLPLLAHPTIQWGRDLLIERGPTGAKLAGKAMGEIGDGDNGNQGKTAAPGDRQFVAIRTPKFLYAEYANGEKDCTTWPGIRRAATVAGWPARFGRGRVGCAARRLEYCGGAAGKVGPSVSSHGRSARSTDRSGQAPRQLGLVLAQEPHRHRAHLLNDGRVVLRQGILPKRC